MEAKEKLSFSEWREHIWYYYKWLILLGTPVAIFLIIAIVQIFTKTQPDVYMMYTGKATVTVKGNNQIKEFLYGLIDDYNKDGKKNIQYMELTGYATEYEHPFEHSVLTSDGAYDTSIQYSTVVLDADRDSQLMASFQTEISSGDSIIYMVDKFYYNKLKELGVLAPLSDVLYEQDIPEKTLDGYGIWLKDLDIYKTAAFKQLPENTVLCIRRSPDQDQLKYNRTVEKYSASKQCFIKMIQYKFNENDG